jgi:molybdate transport system regulatory protein
MAKTRAGAKRPPIRIRVLAGSEIAMGPGKADLLDAIAETGSISAAARRMRMSYRRAWLLVQTMNECFAEPLVSAAKGGKAGGGAALTSTGAAVLARYRQLSETAAAALSPFLGRPGR